MTGLGPERIAAAGLAHVPENRLVFPSLTVADNLALGGWTPAARPGGVAADAGTACSSSSPGWRPRLAQPAGTLSGGEQQMVAIGRGLMAGPTVLVLDEPSVGLAPRLVAEIFATLGRLRDEQGLAILLVEQNARAAFRVADRVAVMDRGRVVLEGDAGDLLADPRVTAGFLGGGFAAEVPAPGAAAPRPSAPGDGGRR